MQQLQVEELKVLIEEFFGGDAGMGDPILFDRERQMMIEKKNEPQVMLLDLKRRPVRNRYLPEHERRIKLVRRGSSGRADESSTYGVASAEDLAKRLPGVGEKKAGWIWEVIKRDGKIESLDQLAHILSKTDPYGGAVFHQILPFISIYNRSDLLDRL